jgi:DNA transformation protein and related proteins
MKRQVGKRARSKPSRTPTRAKPARRRLAALKVSAAFAEFAIAQVEALGDVTSKAMFGGVGLYHDGVFFGILARDTLYFKVDDSSRAAYQAAGMAPFKPYEGRPGTMKYYAVPLEVLESAPELVAWARKAVAAGRGIKK